MKDILGKSLIEKLKLIQDFLQDQPSDIEDLLKQYVEYDFCAQNLRKIQWKYSKKWFYGLFTLISCDPYG